ncbi:MAG: PIG-L family deacetylase [Candidatus Latescibacteria bacterium]|nr:PIG-L family deacetylase [Candidatus Latescibacterota bacterium]
MRILYIFPHPDDESFGPSTAMSVQRRQEHEVFLLTLTRGEATKQRHKYGYSPEEMGDVRYKEMQNVAKVLDLNGLTVLNLPDSGLKEVDPRIIEKAIIEHFEAVRPEVVVTYPVHGISGFHDHLVTHAVVKRVYLELKERTDYLRRLAFYTVTEEQAAGFELFNLKGSKPVEIDCVYEVEEIDLEKANLGLDCYVTYRNTIDKSGIRDFIKGKAHFEIFQEDFDPPLKDLCVSLQ